MENDRTPTFCEKCRAPLTRDAPQGLCPACLLKLGIASLAAAARHGRSSGPSSLEKADLEFILERPGAMIGRYRLVELLGEGGFGVVYMARQVEPVEREVALKVIKAGMDSREVIARFEAERQALALMDHPGISRVFDGGVTQTGRPYFVMELVRGTPITRFCGERKLPVSERLRLFIHVCKAVQHAHQKGIIHRDLKPSNILVALHDGDPVPKVIDFGVAKALEHELTNKTPLTGFLHMVGTPAYMSPEQAELGVIDIDTRSDIYALGVLLYELLTGETPFEAKELLAAGLDQMRRTIREVEPVRPGIRLTQSAAASGAKDGGASASIFDPESSIDSDLDWIVMKCLEKDRQRRYETVNGLALDVQRHLDNEPVVARPPGAGYRLRKFIRRNKLAFAAGSAVALSLIAGLTISVVSLLREKAARGKAERAEKTAEAAVLEKQEQRWRSQHIEARGYRLSGQLGQRARALQVIEEAAKWRPSVELRNEAIAALLLPDLGPDVWFRDQRDANFNFACDPDMEHYMPYKPSGRIEVRRTRDHSVVASFAGLSVDTTWSRFSPDGRRLAVHFGMDGGKSRVGLWDWRTGRLLLSLVIGYGGEIRPVFDFTPDGREFVVATRGGPVRRFETENGTELDAPLAESNVEGVQISPSGKSIATQRGAELRVWDVSSGKEKARGILPGPLGTGVRDVAWHPHEELLAVGTGAGLFLWKIGVKPPILIGSQQSHVSHVFFNADGDLLFAGGWGDAIQIWDPQSGQLLYSGKEGAPVQLSRDGNTLAYARERIGIGARRFLRPVGLRRLMVPPSDSGEYGTPDSDFHPNGRWLLTAHVNGWLIWDLTTARIVARNRSGRINTAKFLPDGSGILTCGSDGVKRWKIPAALSPLTPPTTQNSPASPPPVAPEPEIVFSRPPRQFERIALSPDGLRFAAVSVAGAGIVCRLDGSSVVPLSGSDSRPGNYVYFSPDSRWIVTSVQHGTRISVYDASSGAHVRDLPIASMAGFPPHGNYLMGSDAREFALWRTGTWELLERRPWEPAGAGASVFSRDGLYYFVNDPENNLRFRNSETHRDFATFTFPGTAGWSTCFDANGRQMATISSIPQVYLWNLPEIRQELALLGLDWPNEHPGEGFVGRVTGN